MITAENAGLSRKEMVLYALVVLLAFAIPPALSLKQLPFISSTYGQAFVAFELLGFTMGAVLLFITYREAKKRWHLGMEGVIPVLVFCLVGFQFLVWICECTQAGDFKAYYVPAAAKLASGGNPYIKTGYFYPPLLVECLAAGCKFVGLAASKAHIKATPYVTMGVLYYAFTCVQFCIAMLAYLLGVRMVRCLGARGMWVPILVGAVFILNNPLIRTFRYGQVNFWLLDAVLLVLISDRLYAFWTGTVMATAIHLKLYPVILVPSMVLAKRWRQLAWCAAVAIGIVLVETRLGTHTKLWRQYLSFAPTLSGTGCFRDNSLLNVVSQSVHFLSRGASWEGSLTRVLMLLGRAAVLLWMGSRALKREKTYRSNAAGLESGDDAADAQMIRFYGHTLDLVSLTLILGPRVWEHHYVLAIPLILWAVVAQRDRRPLFCAAGAMLILLPTTFDFFPFSYHRLLGLLLLTLAARPTLSLEAFHKNANDFTSFGQPTQRERQRESARR